MITTKLKELVRIEADNLRKHASADELSNLDFEHLNSNDVECCIYGQMTGMCFEERASELIALCAPMFVEWNFESDEEFSIFNNKMLRKTFKAPDDDGRSLSPIEVYIGHKNAKSKNLIEYLRGETDTLEL